MTNKIVEFIDKFNVDFSANSSDWYTVEHNNIAHTANYVNKHIAPITPKILFAMVAITSPLVKWEYNIETAVNLIMDYHNLKRLMGGRCMGLSANRDKATKLYSDYVNGVNIDDDYILSTYLKGKKTSAFFLNLSYPINSQAFTLDVWMIRLYMGEYQSATNTHKTTDKERDIMRQNYIDTFYALRNAGRIPNTCSISGFQAVLWTYVKRYEVACKWFTDSNILDKRVFI